MKTLLVATRHTWNWTLRLSIILIILLALLLALSRLLLSDLSTYQAELEQMISAHWHAPVQIRSTEVTWWGWGPALRLDDFSLLDADGHTPLLSFEQSLIGVDVSRSLSAGRPVLSHIRLQGGSLSLERTADGTLRLFANHAGSSPITLQDLIPWLFAIDHLDAIFEHLQLRNAGDGRTWEFNDLRLSLRGEGLKRRLDLALNLPETLGDSLQGAVELHGKAHDPNTWEATFYARVQDLQMASWPLPKAPAAGQANVAVWGDWQWQGLKTVLGKAHFQDLMAPKLPGSASLNELLTKLPGISVDFAWWPRDQGWQWHSNWTGVNEMGMVVRNASMHLFITAPQDAAPPEWQGEFRNLHLQDLVAVAAPWLNRNQLDLLKGIALSGQVPELRFRITGMDENHDADCRHPGCAQTYALTGRFQRLATRPWKRIPGIETLDGNFSLDQEGGRLELDSHAVQVNASKLLQEPVSFDTLSGLIQWRREAGNLHLKSSGLKLANADFKARLQGDLALFGNGTSPWLDLNMQYHDVDVGQIRRYVPVTGIPPKLAAWLNRAFVSGRIPAGELVWRGHTADYPFEQGQGLFETRFQFEDTILDYFPNWPPVEELKGEVLVRNRSLQAKLVAGKVFDAKLKQAQARIDNLAKALLKLEIQAQAAGTTLLRLIEDTPLVRKLGSYVAGMQAQGTNSLDLQLDIPLRPRGPIQVKGAVGFSGGDLKMPAWGVNLSNIQGPLHFTRSTLTAKDLRLNFQGEPGLLDISTQERRDGSRDTNFRLRAQLSSRALLGNHASVIEPYLNGRGHWEVLLTVPAKHSGAPRRPHLILSSDLEGVALKLPPPLGKTANDSRDLTASIEFDGSHTLQLGLNYAPDVQAQLEFSDYPAKPRFQGGELRINAGKAGLPEASGLVVLANLPRLELATLVPGAGGTTSLPPWLHSIDAQLGEVLFGSQRFPEVAVQVRRRDQELTVDLSGKSIAGQLHIPAPSDSKVPMKLALEHLVLHRRKSVQQAATGFADPRTFPPLSVTVENLVLDGNSLGKLRLRTIPQANGLRLSEFDLRRADSYQITATGDWQVTKIGQISRLEAKLHSRKLGKTLDAFGYTVGLEGGQTEAALTASWSAPLLELAFQQMDGDLNLKVGDGQLTDVEPGVGRMFGLLNLYSLSRRLQLDFSDLFDKGMSFDSIDGHFTFRDGQAYTDDLILTGPPAEIQFIGRTGLKARDYDQIITVTPRVGLPVSIAGAIAGGPVVGAALFLADRLIDGGVGRVTRYQYRLTGTWDNPVMERISRVTEADDFLPTYNRNR